MKPNGIANKVQRSEDHREKKRKIKSTKNCIIFKKLTSRAAAKKKANAMRVNFNLNKADEH